jgi:outer membrane protein TolC
MTYNAVRVVPPLLLILWSILGAPFPACVQASEAIQPGERLSLERCLEIALSRHPSIQGARYTIQAQESRIGQAQSSYLPQVTWQNTYSRNAPYTSSSSRLTGTGPYDQFGSNIGLSQNIYDFQRTPTQVRIARINADATRRDLDHTISQVILGVKQGFYGLIQAEKNLDVARETLEQFQQHLSRAQGYFNAGLKPKFDVTKAEGDLGNARLNFIRAENACGSPG